MLNIWFQQSDEVFILVSHERPLKVFSYISTSSIANSIDVIIENPICFHH